MGLVWMNIFYVWIILVIVGTLEPRILGDFDGQRLRSGWGWELHLSVILEVDLVRVRVKVKWLSLRVMVFGTELVVGIKLVCECECTMTSWQLLHIRTYEERTQLMFSFSPISVFSTTHRERRQQTAMQTGNENVFYFFYRLSYLIFFILYFFLNVFTMCIKKRIKNKKEK